MFICTHKNNPAAISLAVIGISVSHFTFAESMIDDISKAFNESNIALTLRYRYETVDQDDIPRDAAASTLRSRMTITSGMVSGFRGFIEIDKVSYLGGEAFNNTDNGKTQYPVVADPDYTDINQALVSYFFDDKNKVAVGRQRINHDNQRFLGGVGWRQNEQTFDAVRFNLLLVDGLSLDYSYIWKVSRIFEPDSSMSDYEGDNHAFIANYQVAIGHTISAFVYLLDLDGVRGPAVSSSTYGMKYKGNIKINNGFDLNVALSYAEQSDYKDNPTDYDANYYFVELAAQFQPLTVAIGREVLGSDDGIKAFGTLLATGHLFQGFADKFLATPIAGVEDSYLKVATRISGVKLTAIYHELEAEEGSMDYGSELDLIAGYRFNKHYSIFLKYASYDADEYATDTDKVWLMITAAF